MARKKGTRTRSSWRQPASASSTSDEAAGKPDEAKTTTTLSGAAASLGLAPGQMTTNFWESEVGKSNTATRLGIDNDPPVGPMAKAKLLAVNVLQPIRDEFGAYGPESWFRCEKLERVLTTSGFMKWCLDRNVPKDMNAWNDYFPLKSHPKGEAADIEINGVDNLKLFEWIRDNLDYDQVIIEGYRSGVRNSGWVHVSYREGNNRMQAFGIDNP